MIDNYYVFFITLSITLFLTSNALFFINLSKSDDLKFNVSLLVIVITAFVFGVRGVNIGIDSGIYADVFNEKLLNRNDELFFTTLARIIKWLGGDVTIFFIAINILIGVVLLLGLKKISRDYSFLMGLVLTTFIYINLNISLIRQGVAISLIFYATTCLLNKQYTKYWVFVFSAVLFHSTAIFSVLFFLLKDFELNNKRLIIYLLMCGLCNLFYISDVFYYLSGISEYFSRIYWYFQWEKLTAWKIKHFYYLLLCMVVFLIIYRNKLAIVYRDVLNFYLLGVLLLLLFRQEEMVADRFFYYFLPFNSLLIKCTMDIMKIKWSVLNFSIMILLANMWLATSIGLQYPAWFLPPFEALMK